MDSDTKPVIWPTSLNQEAVTLIKQLFFLLDRKDSDAGQRLFDEVFTIDADFFASNGHFRGREIVKSRDGIWDKFDVRRHELRKVFVNDVGDVDVLIMGTAFVKPCGEEQVTLEFIARAILQDRPKGMRIRYYQTQSLKQKGPNETRESTH